MVSFVCSTNCRVRTCRVRTCGGRLRGGFTLVEVLLVLVILAIVAGIVWPLLDGAFSKNRIEKTAADVYSELASARNHAIETGLIYQFRFEPNGRRYLVIPYEQDADDLAAEEGGGNGAVRRPRVAGELPEGVLFSVEEDDAGGGLSEMSTGKISPELLSGLRDADELRDVNWSPPILFFTDGSSQSARFIVKDEKSQMMRFSVRELTGAVSLSRVLQGDL